MGAWGSRITAADFLTPPELAGLSLASNPAGRIGGVRLELVATPQGTQLGQVYQQVPLRVLPPFSFGSGEPALLYLLNPTAGLLDGDAQLLQIHAGPGSRAVVTGQSATRIHPAVDGFCTQQWLVQVEPGAVLVILPGPAIPFKDCRYYQRVAIELAQGAELVWGDLWLAGRSASGAIPERFQFRTLVQDLAVSRQGRLVFRDRFCWRGPWDADTTAWHFGSALACGSLFVSGPVPESAVLSAGAVEAAWMPTGAGDTCVRWQGTSEEVTTSLVRTALRAAAALASPDRQQPWLHAPDLAPNHWFSVSSERA